MGKDWDEFDIDDELCLGCGEYHYVPSRTPGLCKRCADPVLAAKDNEQNDAGE